MIFTEFPTGRATNLPGVSISRPIFFCDRKKQTDSPLVVSINPPIFWPKRRPNGRSTCIPCTDQSTGLLTEVPTDRPTNFTRIDQPKLRPKSTPRRPTNLRDINQAIEFSIGRSTDSLFINSRLDYRPEYRAANRLTCPVSPNRTNFRTKVPADRQSCCKA